jgi:preprotein translocase subunit Sss1
MGGQPKKKSKDNRHAQFEDMMMNKTEDYERVLEVLRKPAFDFEAQFSKINSAE